MKLGALQRAVFGLMLAFWLASATFVRAQGTIIYHQPSVPLYPLIGQEVDVDGGGQVEFQLFDRTEIGASFFGTAAQGVASARLLVIPQGPNDIGSYLVGVEEGFAVGGPLRESWFWAASDAPNGYGQAIVLGTWLPPEGNQLIPAGFFHDTTAFMGIHFQIGESWHYGWVRIQGEGGEDVLAPQGWILDWAYESRPDTPILAGAVPEPSTWALLVGGGVLVVWFGRERNERRG